MFNAKNLPLCMAMSVVGISSAKLYADESYSNKFAIEEVVVTARKKSESLQEVPLSITPFSGETIERRDFVNLEDIASNTVGMSYSQGATSGFQESPTIRGLRQGFLQDRVQNVAIFLDGVYLSRQSMANMGMVDMERIEVVKGPQNSLYGRNAFSGAINYVTKKPQQETQVYVSTTQGSDNRNDWKFSATGTLIEDRLLGRYSYGQSKFDGHTENEHPYAGVNPGGFTNGGSDKKLGGWDDTTYSMALTFLATESLTFDASYYNTELQRESQPGYVLNGVTEVGKFQTTPFSDMNKNQVTVSTQSMDAGGPYAVSTGNTYWQGALPTRVSKGAWVGSTDANGVPNLDWGYGVGVTADDPRATGFTPMEDPRGYGVIANSEVVSFGFDWEINENWSSKYLFGWIDHKGSQQGPAERDQLFATTLFDVVQPGIDRVDAYIQSNAFASRPVVEQNVFSHELRFDWTGNDFMSASFGAFYSEVEDKQDDITSYMGICTSPDLLIDKDQDATAACSERVSTSYSATPLQQAEYLSILNFFGEQWHGAKTNGAEYNDTILAAFAMLEFNLTPAVTFRVEGRFTQEEKEIQRTADVWGILPGQSVTASGLTSGPTTFISQICAPGASVDILGEPCILQKEKKTWNYFTPKANLDWQVTDNNFLYTYIAEGLKAGGFNNTSVPSQGTYDEEKNWTFEIGSKNTFFDGRVQLNAAAYYIWWQDLVGGQAPQGATASANANVVQANIGDVQNFGFEFDGKWLVTENFSVDFGAAFTNPNYDNDVRYDEAERYYFDGCTPENLLTDTNVDGSSIGGNFDAVINPGELCGNTDVGGNTLPKVSRQMYQIGFNYDYLFDNGWDLAARLGGDYQSKQYLTAMNHGYIPSRTVWNSSISLIGPENWEINFWGKNIFNERYVSGAFNLALFDKQIVSYGPAVTYGVTVKYNIF